MSASKSGKIAGIVVYKPKVTTSKVTVEIRTWSIHIITSKFSEILGSTTYLPGDKLTFITAAEHAILTPAKDPTQGINTKLYRIHEVHRVEVQRQTDQMLTDGIIQSSSSPWNSPILVIPTKPDASVKKKWRIVVDYRKLNGVTVATVFPCRL